jgi:LmbE family N-acetylglucosaminyl deacetylase
MNQIKGHIVDVVRREIFDGVYVSAGDSPHQDHRPSSDGLEYLHRHLLK